MHQEDLQLIEKYIDGELDEKALVDFRARMETDADFAQAVKMEEDIMEGIELWGNKKLKKQLEKIGEEEISGAKVKDINPNRRKFLWAAAAVLGLAVVAKFALFNSPDSPEKLYAKYAVHEFDFTQMSSGGGDLSDIEKLLKTEKYDEAAPLLKNYLKNNSGAHDVRLAYGIALMESGKYEAAHSEFNAIIYQVPALKNDAMWYQALNYLREGQIGKCKTSLEKISEQSARSKMAQMLLSDLG